MQPDPLTDELPLEIGTKVKALRAARGLSGRKLAAAAGVSQPFLSQLESGQTSLGVATLQRLIEAHPAADEARLAAERLKDLGLRVR